MVAGLQDINYTTLILGTDVPSVIDNRMRDLAEAVKKSFADNFATTARHHVTGEHRIPATILSSLSGFGNIANDLRFNASSGNLEIRLNSDIVYGFTATMAAAGVTVTAAGADFLNQLASFTRPAIVTDDVANKPGDFEFYYDADAATPGAAKRLFEVDSASQLTLRASYTIGPFPRTAAATVRLKTAGSWYPVADILQNFLLEHWKTGEHRFPLVTPNPVRPGQLWIDGGTIQYADASGVASNINGLTPVTAGFAPATRGFNFTPKAAIGTPIDYTSTASSLSAFDTPDFFTNGLVVPNDSAFFDGHGCVFSDLAQAVKSYDYTGDGATSGSIVFPSVAGQNFTPDAVIILTSSGDKGSRCCFLAKTASQMRTMSGARTCGAATTVFIANGFSYATGGLWNANLTFNVNTVKYTAIFFKTFSNANVKIAVGEGDSTALSFTPHVVFVQSLQTTTDFGVHTTHVLSLDAYPVSSWAPAIGGALQSSAALGVHSIVKNGVNVGATFTYRWLALAGGPLARSM
jgi:hypothetical protein